MIIYGMHEPLTSINNILKMNEICVSRSNSAGYTIVAT